MGTRRWEPAVGTQSPSDDWRSSSAFSAPWDGGIRAGVGSVTRGHSMQEVGRNEGCLGRERLNEGKPGKGF